jgi:hypothetical protein
MKCNIVLHPFCRGWIIEKMALRLNEGLRSLSVDSSINESFAADADVNHFMMFHYIEGSKASKNTMFITHVDDALKIRMIKDSLNIVDVGICMSRMTVRSLVEQGIPRDSLCYISPAHDGSVIPRRIRIGITSNLYPDGRKREAMLARLAKEISLDDLHFEIFGKGWNKIAERLQAGGATIEVHQGTSDLAADYADICQRIPEFDYYLYMGLDEGALGTLDALAAGIPTITTPQGFHLDVPDGITYPFWDYNELREILEFIVSARRRRVAAVSSLTWTEYARKHVQVWQSLLVGKKNELPQVLGQEHLDQIYQPMSIPKQTIVHRVLAYTRMANRYRWNMAKGYYLPRVRRRILRALK